MNSEGNGIMGGKLVRPTRPCRVCYWPASGESLLTPDLAVWFQGQVKLIKVA